MEEPSLVSVTSMVGRVDSLHSNIDSKYGLRENMRLRLMVGFRSALWKIYGEFKPRECPELCPGP